mmetsp:Transcript_6717/g.41036  ORF Transcript_6717/g.41036 Transcript_6717/m.41036 type:complete len:102 (+) Transcript_6717:3-308(+)
MTDLLGRHVVETMDHVPTKECVKLRAMLRTKAKRTVPRRRCRRSSEGIGGGGCRTVSGVNSSMQSTKACVSCTLNTASLLSIKGTTMNKMENQNLRGAFPP